MDVKVIVNDTITNIPRSICQNTEINRLKEMKLFKFEVLVEPQILILYFKFKIPK